MEEDMGLFRQGWKWVKSKSYIYWSSRKALGCCRDKIVFCVEFHWPMVCSGSAKLGKFILMVLLQWRGCVRRGLKATVGFGSAGLLIIMWSFFLSLTSMQCLLYVLLMLGAAGAAVRYLGYTSGLFIVGLFGIMILWIYGNLWIAGTLFLVGGYLFSLDHARLVVLMATAYTVYSVIVRVGWPGVILSVNLAYISDDIMNYLLHEYEHPSQDKHLNEEKHSKEQKEPEKATENNFSSDGGYSFPTTKAENLHSCKSSKTPATSTHLNVQTESPINRVIKTDTVSADEMKRIINSLDHYEALGLSRNKTINGLLLRKEYLKKAMLVHPDKNMGSSLASESFKKLQCAYEVLSDSVKRKDYDEQLRKEESGSVCEKSSHSSQQDHADYQSQESRRIQCTKCGNSHIWICTNRTKFKARWCEDCCQYHQAKDGDGWVEYRCSLDAGRPQQVEIPRAFVCAESKIFDVSEWAICQGMTCRPNTHRPSFHINMVGLENASQRASNSNVYPWNLDAEMMEEEDEFDMWLQQALATGLFSETTKRRKSWSPFKLHQKKGKKYWH